MTLESPQEMLKSPALALRTSNGLNGRVGKSFCAFLLCQLAAAVQASDATQNKEPR